MPSPDLSSSSNLSRGYLFALASAAVLSTTAIFIRYLTQTFQMPALILAAWREFFVVVTLLPILVIFKPALLKVNTKIFKYLVIYGLVLAAFNSFWTLSVSLNGAAVATVLAYCSAGFSALLGRFVLFPILTLSSGVLVSHVRCRRGNMTPSGRHAPK